MKKMLMSTMGVSIIIIKNQLLNIKFGTSHFDRISLELGVTRFLEKKNIFSKKTRLHTHFFVRSIGFNPIQLDYRNAYSIYILIEQ